jgi:hypothetical protein
MITRAQEQGEGVPADDPRLHPPHPGAGGPDELRRAFTMPSMKRASNICHSHSEARTAGRTSALS